MKPILIDHCRPGSRRLVIRVGGDREIRGFGGAVGGRLRQGHRRQLPRRQSRSDQRMKDCLLRNQDVLTPQCKSEYSRAFEAIQKRVAARLAVSKLCERDMVKLCRRHPEGRSRCRDRLPAGGAARHRHQLRQVTSSKRGIADAIGQEKPARHRSARGRAARPRGASGSGAGPGAGGTSAGDTSEEWIKRLAGLETDAGARSRRSDANRRRNAIKSKVGAGTEQATACWRPNWPSCRNLIAEILVRRRRRGGAARFLSDTGADRRHAHPPVACWVTNS